MAKNMMATTMLLAPWLATYTYACPHLITPIAVAGAARPNMRKTTPNMRAAVATTPLTAPLVNELREAVAAPLELPPAPKPADLLIHKDDAWRSVPSITPEVCADPPLRSPPRPECLASLRHTHSTRRARRRLRCARILTR